MKRIYFATTNDWKFKRLERGLKKAWGELGFLEELEVVQKKLEIKEPKTSLEKIARLKVINAYEQIKKPCVAWDSGFFIPYLGGFPGVEVNRYLKEKGIEDLFKRLRKKGFEKQLENKEVNCYFVHCLAYNPTGKGADIQIYRGDNAEGILLSHPQGIGNIKTDLKLYFQPTGKDIPGIFAEKTIWQIKDRNQYNLYWDWRHSNHFKTLAIGINSR